MSALENHEIRNLNSGVRKVRSVGDNNQTITGDRNQNITGHDLAKFDPNLHYCVLEALHAILNYSDCDDMMLKTVAISKLDDCYKASKIIFKNLLNTTEYSPFTRKINGSNFQQSKALDQLKNQPASIFFKKKFKATNKKKDEVDNHETEMDWSFGSSVLFSFSVITSIGYGHVAPKSQGGRLFCILYGLFGIPLTLLTIANVGMNFSRIFQMSAIKILKWKTKLCKKYSFGLRPKIGQINKKENKIPLPEQQNNLWHISDNKNMNSPNVVDTQKTSLEEEDEIDVEANENQLQLIMIVLLGVSSFLYLLFGAYFLSLYEKDMGYFEGFYFCYITMLTIGLGDYYPQSYEYLPITIIYVFFGMALITVTINLLSDLLKKLHNVGRQVENVGDVSVWFGGKRMKMSNLLKHMVDKFNLPEDALQSINLDKFIDHAIQKEAGKIESLRPKAFSFSDVAILYEEELCNDVMYMDTSDGSYLTKRDTTSRLNSDKNLLSIRSKPDMENGYERVKRNKDSSSGLTPSTMKITLDSLTNDASEVSLNLNSRITNSDIFYLPTFETGGRSLDDVSFDENTTFE
uniref:Ion_trans_2 domain-containing protein n=1 Tax=Rhabditophanes sp. KR3021 TaxID=114890 RepID=A0AC35U3T5_9BILA